jgi:hypothetical protein
MKGDEHSKHTPKLTIVNSLSNGSLNSSIDISNSEEVRSTNTKNPLSITHKDKNTISTNAEYGEENEEDYFIASSPRSSKWISPINTPKQSGRKIRKPDLIISDSSKSNL